MGWRTYAMKLGEKGKTVRLGVIGLGGRGMSQTDTLLQMPDVEIVAVCDVYDDRVQKGQDLVFEKRGVRPDGETDYKKVLARPDIDAICVFTSWETHIDICVQAMRAAVSAGKIGSVVSGYAQFTCWYPDIPNCWRQNKRQGGGGALMDMGVHCIDLMQYITGSRVREVAAFNDTLTFHYEVEDTSVLLLRLENGAVCTVQSNFNIPDDAAKWRLEFFGTQGRLLGDQVIGQVDGGAVDAMFLGHVGGYDAQQSGDKARGELLPITPVNTYTAEIESFSNSILTGAPLAAPASDAVQVQRIIEAAYRASREKRTILL